MGSNPVDKWMIEDGHVFLRRNSRMLRAALSRGAESMFCSTCFERLDNGLSISLLSVPS